MSRPDLIRIAITLIICSLGAASAMVWLLLLHRWSVGRPALPRADRPGPQWHITADFAVILALGWTLLILAGVVFQDAAAREADLGQLQFTCAIALTLTLALGALLAGKDPDNLRSFGITTDDLSGQFRDGTVTYLGIILPVVAALLLTAPLRSSENQHVFLRLLQSDSGTETLFWMVLAVVVMAPLSEELIFRVVLQGALRRVATPAGSVIAVAMLFSAVHGMPDALPLLPLALGLGYLYDRRRSYFACVIMHALFNGTNLLLKLLELQLPRELIDSAAG